MSASPIQPPARRTRRGSGAITLHDVAKLAGVAPITASRALRSPHQVSAEVLRKVGEAVARTGYVPNLLAGGLASTRSRLVAAVVPTISAPVFLDSVQSLTEALADRGYQLMLGQSGYTGGREDALLEAIIGRRPDGIVLTGVMHSSEGRRRLLACGIPVVETWDLTPTPIDMLVGFSHEEVGRAVASYLHAKGRRRLAMASGDDPRARRRAAAFVARALELGQSKPTTVFVPTPTSPQRGREAMAELLRRQPGLDGVFCSSDWLALGVVTEAQARGIGVPSRLAVLGFGGLEFASALEPALSTVQINGAAIGRRAAQFIADRAEGIEVEQRIVDIGFAVVERQSS